MAPDRAQAESLLRELRNTMRARSVYQVGLDGEVEVRVLVTLELFADHRQRRGIGAEVGAGPAQQLGLLGRSLLRDLVHEALE